MKTGRMALIYGNRTFETFSNEEHVAVNQFVKISNYECEKIVEGPKMQITTRKMLEPFQITATAFCITHCCIVCFKIPVMILTQRTLLLIESLQYSTQCLSTFEMT